VVFDDTTRNASLLKVQPFSSYPSQVEVHLDDHFHAFAGCAMEATAVSRMPAFEDKPLRLESYCACCFEPIALDVRNGVLESASVDADALADPRQPQPLDWGNPNIEMMCDSMKLRARCVPRLGPTKPRPVGWACCSPSTRPDLRGRHRDNRMWTTTGPPRR